MKKKVSYFFHSANSCLVKTQIIFEMKHVIDISVFFLVSGLKAIYFINIFTVNLI